MISDLLAQMRLQSKISSSNLAFTKFGVIKNYNPTNFTVKVQLYPAQTEDTTLTGYIPLMSPWTGSEWGMFAAPALNSQCLVFFADASFSAPIGAAGIFNNQNRPLAVPSEEFWIVHKSGSSIKFTNDGNVEIKGNSTINVDGQNVNLGHISSGNLKKLLNETAQQVFNTHTHSSNGAPPSQQMDATSLTENTEAN